MTPAEHYATADKLLDEYAERGHLDYSDGGAALLAEAQVHATLATVGPGDWAHVTPEPETGDYWPEDR